MGCFGKLGALLCVVVVMGCVEPPSSTPTYNKPDTGNLDMGGVREDAGSDMMDMGFDMRVDAGMDMRVSEDADMGGGDPVDMDADMDMSADIFTELMPSLPPGSFGFGRSMAMSEDGLRLLIAAPVNHAGGAAVNAEVHYFAREDRTQRFAYKNQVTIDSGLRGSDTSSEWGYAMALDEDGSTAVICAPKYGRNGSNSGVCDVFERGEDGVFVHQHEVRPVGTESDRFFGASVAISPDGQWLVVGEPGKGVVSVWPNMSGVSAPTYSLGVAVEGEAKISGVGASLAVSWTAAVGTGALNARIAFGAPDLGVYVSDKFQLLIPELPESKPSHELEVDHDDWALSGVGQSLMWSSDYLFIGAPGSVKRGSDGMQGAVLMYHCESNCGYEDVISADSPEHAIERFGVSMDMMSDMLCVGAPAWGGSDLADFGTWKGRVYCFEPSGDWLPGSEISFDGVEGGGHLGRMLMLDVLGDSHYLIAAAPFTEVDGEPIKGKVFDIAF